jgi:hypothetical protein
VVDTEGTIDVGNISGVEQYRLGDTREHTGSALGAIIGDLKLDNLEIGANVVADDVGNGILSLHSISRVASGNLNLTFLDDDTLSTQTRVEDFRTVTLNLLDDDDNDDFDPATKAVSEDDRFDFATNELVFLDGDNNGYIDEASAADPDWDPSTVYSRKLIVTGGGDQGAKGGSVPFDETIATFVATTGVDTVDLGTLHNVLDTINVSAFTGRVRLTLDNLNDTLIDPDNATGRNVDVILNGYGAQITLLADGAPVVVSGGVAAIPGHQPSAGPDGVLSGSLPGGLYDLNVAALALQGDDGQATPAIPPSPGPDGVLGTADDGSATQPQAALAADPAGPGVDGILGTADDGLPSYGPDGLLGTGDDGQATPLINADPGAAAAPGPFAPPSPGPDGLFGDPAVQTSNDFADIYDALTWDGTLLGDDGQATAAQAPLAADPPGPGPDGIQGTNDDGLASFGPDGLSGTADDGQVTPFIPASPGVPGQAADLGAVNVPAVGGSTTDDNVVTFVFTEDAVSTSEVVYITGFTAALSIGATLNNRDILDLTALDIFNQSDVDINQVGANTEIVGNDDSLNFKIVLIGVVADELTDDNFAGN